MASFNQATIIGFVGDEPRIIQTQSNTAMASFQSPQQNVAISAMTARKSKTVPNGITWFSSVSRQTSSVVMCIKGHRCSFKGNFAHAVTKTKTASSVMSQKSLVTTFNFLTKEQTACNRTTACL